MLETGVLEKPVNLIGITAHTGSIADKLSAPFSPDTVKEEVSQQRSHVIEQMKKAGILGPFSNVVPVQDRWLFEASRIALQLRLRAEPSALAGLAWLLAHKNQVPKGSRVIVVNTGRGMLE